MPECVVGICYIGYTAFVYQQLHEPHHTIVVPFESSCILVMAKKTLQRTMVRPLLWRTFQHPISQSMQNSFFFSQSVGMTISIIDMTAPVSRAPVLDGINAAWF